jgi:ABC-type branched-subunit amino acid transport system ATPase component
MTNLLEAEHVCKLFGGLVAVNEVDLAIPEHSIASIIGPNGAGKTTLFNCISGFYTPEKGRVLFQGHPIQGMLTDRIAQDIKGFTDKGHRSVGILARTKGEANEAYRLLKEKTQVGAIVSGNQEYVKGAVVMPAYLAKGLEFDTVILYNAGGGNYSRDEERLLLYTACTRALHVLHIYHIGERSPLLPQTI